MEYEQKTHIAKWDIREHIEMYCGRVGVTFHNDILRASCKTCIKNYKAHPTKPRYTTTR